MAWNKNSGRKPLRDEAVQANVINMSWFSIQRALNSKKVSEREKRLIALEIVKKTCPQKLDIKTDGFRASIYNIIQSLQRDFQENSGTPLALAPGDGLDERRT